MKILIFALYVGIDEVLAHTMEMAKLERQKGNEIYIICCDASVEFCLGKEKKGSRSVCIQCQYRQRKVLKEFQIDETNVFFLKEKPFKIYPFEGMTHIDEIKKCTYNGINIGIGVASSFVSSIRDIDANLDNHKEFLGLIAHTAHVVLDNVPEIIEKVKPDKVYIYNGRIVESRAMLEYCKYKKIPFTTYDVGSTFNRYTTFEGTLPHDMAMNAKLAIDKTNQNPIEAKQKGTNWFINRRRGSVGKTDISYIGNQEKNKLPKSFENREGKHIIAVFNSSEDEVAVLGEDIWKTYGRQSDIIEDVVREFEKLYPDYFFYIRIHPNLKALTQTKEVQKIITLPQHYKNVEVILSDENVDTYALMEKSDKTLSFGSTTGIEATFWNKPSITYGSAFYKDIPNAAYFPTSFEELTALLKDKELKPLSKEAALIYGYYIMEAGSELEKYTYPLFGKDNRFETKNDILYWYTRLYNFLIKNRFPMRLFPQKIVYNFFLKK